MPCTSGIEIGSIADWFSGIGSVGALASAVVFGIHEIRRANNLKEEINRQNMSEKRVIFSEVRNIIENAEKTSSEFISKLDKKEEHWTDLSIGFIFEMNSMANLLVKIQSTSRDDPLIVATIGNLVRIMEKHMTVATNGETAFRRHAERLIEEFRRNKPLLSERTPEGETEISQR